MKKSATRGKMKAPRKGKRAHNLPKSKRNQLDVSPVPAGCAVAIDPPSLDICRPVPYISKLSFYVHLKRELKGEVAIDDAVNNPPPSELYETQIIELCKRGDRSAFNELVRRHHRKIFNLCFRILGNRHEAEDVAQDVFVTAFRAIRSFRGDSALSTWLHRVAVNNCKNRLKYLKRRKYFQTESMDATYDDGESEMTREFKDEGEDSPEDTRERTELSREIQGAIDRLDEDYRVVIVLRDVQGFSYQEIAEILDLKEGTVKSRIHRARSELQQKLRHLIE